MSDENLSDYFYYKDGNLYNRVRRGRSLKDKKLGSVGSHGYLEMGFKNKTYLVHRLIYELYYGYVPNFIDHIDGNKLNNNIENLRNCSNAENCRNSKKPSNNTSGFKGVHWRSDVNKWRVKLEYKGKQLYFGYYDDIKEAAEAYNKAAIKYFGEFANVNDIRK